VVLYACAFSPAAWAAGGDPLRAHQWGLDLIHADAAHTVSTGAGAVVAVVDTGIDAAHPDLAGRIGPGIDLVDGDSTPQDGNGHGTHVSGIIAADAGNGVGVDSVAPGATIMPVRVLDGSGSGADSTVAQGIDWATAHRADVINLSLGSMVPLPGLGVPDDISAAVQRAVDHGVIVVAAAGNDALPFCENGTAQGKVLCVGAIDKRGARSFYSSFGQGLGLVAPGGSGLPGTDEDVLSTYNDGGYQELAGTSQATPHVSGVAALLVSLGVRGQAAVQRILATATDIGPPGPDAQFGAGLVNAQAAVAGLGSGPAAGGGAQGRNAAARVTIRHRQKIRAVLRRGIRISCLAAGSGRCSASARRHGKRLARGSAKVALGRTVSFGARPTRSGRRMLRAALRRHVRMVTAVRVTLPGAHVKRRVVLVP
jgi:subtilisin family serine protease